MGEWVDTPGEVLAVLSIAAIVIGALMWLIKAVGSLQKQTQPNGGSSLRDAIVDLERSVHDIHTDVREIRTNQQEHMTWHLNRGDD